MSSWRSKGAGLLLTDFRGARILFLFCLEFLFLGKGAGRNRLPGLLTYVSRRRPALVFVKSPSVRRIVLSFYLVVVG